MESSGEVEGVHVNGIEQLLVEIVDPELVEVADDDVGRPVRNDIRPVVENLVGLEFAFLATGFHLDEHALRPYEVDVIFSHTAAAFLGDAGFAGGTGFLHPCMAEDAEQVIEEIGGLTLSPPVRWVPTWVANSASAAARSGLGGIYRMREAGGNRRKWKPRWKRKLFNR